MITEKMIKDYFEQNECPLQPIQKCICLPVINRMVKKMQHDIKFADILVHEGLIVNGHHRYIASIFAGIKIGQSEGGKPNRMVTDWKSIGIDTEDWDTPAKLLKINQDDADFNELSLEAVVAIVE